MSIGLFGQPHVTQAGAALDQEVERGADLWVVLAEIEELERLQLADKRGEGEKVAAGPPIPRRRVLDLLFEVDLEHLVKRARTLRAVELIPGLADQGDGVPHQALVLDRLKDRHEQLLREVVDGLRAVVDGDLGDVVVVIVGGGRRDGLEGVVVCFGHRSASTLVRYRGFLLFRSREPVKHLAGGTRRLS